MPKFDVMFVRQSRSTENGVMVVEAQTRDEARVLAWEKYSKSPNHISDWEVVDNDLLYDAIECVTETVENQE